MECTQRLELECTQDLYDTHTERTCPEQIGFLGICGAKHPVLKGPNKIGRDPQTCSIVLNLNSVSRQHAVINVLNSKEYMLMDLDSANKTKLQNKTLQPYIPHPLHDGDTVQFGDIFGIFRLLEEDDALPMTQAIDIPETPVASKPVSKLHKVATTMIPESPDVSDRDDSFITPSQPKSGKSKLSNSSFIKPLNNTASMQLGSSPKTYSNRSSAKKSTSLSFIENPNTSLNESLASPKSDKNIGESIHEMDTQPPNPIANESTDSIYTANTQIPPGRVSSPSIHNIDTQLPTTEHLPLVQKIHDQHEMQFDIYAANKENNKDIFNAETQPFGCDNNESPEKNKNKTNLNSPRNESKEKLNSSEEELLFDDVDGEFLEEDFNSQNILQDNLPHEDVAEKVKSVTASKRDTRTASDSSTTDCEDIDMMLTQKIPALPTKDNKQTAKKEPKGSKRTARLKSDSSTDCEDISIEPTQVIPALPNKKLNTEEKSNIQPSKRINRIESGSSTDCEDIDLIPTQKIPAKKADDGDITDCEDDVVEITENEPNKTSKELVEDDLATQIIDFEYKPNQPSFNDMATQIIDADEEAANSKDVAFEDQPTQVIDVIKNDTKTINNACDEIVSPFKIPLQSPIRIKCRDITKLTPKTKTDQSEPIVIDDNYYDATQDIYNDLCSQKEISVAPNADDVVPCSVEDYKVGEKFANIDKELLSPTKNQPDKQGKSVKLNTDVAKLKRMPSDSSDGECSTPKKTRPFTFTDSDLPDSQEIKTSMLSHTRSAVTESSSESEPEVYSEDQFTPIVHRIKKKKPVAKIDLTKKFEVEKLPERVLTRQRKPTAKLQVNAENNKTVSPNFLKPTYLTEQEDQIDEDIITENIKRLKTYEKAKNNKDSNIDESVKEIKKENTSRKKADNKTSEPKEKIKVKIEKPKKKESKAKSETSTRKSDESRKSKDNVKEESLTSTTKTTGMRTRAKNNSLVKQTSDSKTTNKKSVSPKHNKKEQERSNTKKDLENNKKEPDSKRKRTNKQQEKETSVSPEIEIRRSRRQPKPKDKNIEETVKAPKSILKKSIHEQSTVYDVSCSSAESPRNLKRSLVDDSDVPSTKRLRSHNTDTSGITNASLRATPARVMKTQHVLFTAFPSKEVQQKLEKLGAVIVTDVMQCSVVLTVEIKRTFKFLCALGLGRPIVGPGWVQACADTHIIVDPWLYLLKDESAESRFQFNLERTLTGKRNFLKGYNISSTPNVQPKASEMKLIVECSGGTWKEGGSNWVCVSCTRDKELWPALRKRGATIVSTEFILGGVLRQKLDITSNKFP